MMDKLSTELRILASLLDPPDMDAKEAVQELSEHYRWLQPVADELDKVSIQSWRAEHRRLFEDGGRVCLCPPFESAYVHGPMHRQQTQSLKQLYYRVGMSFTGTRPDYLGNLLECMAHLSANRALGKVYWSELWNRHLSRWVPRFCRTLRAESRMVLYRVIADRLCDLFPEVRHALYEVA
jgi:TorA maturation chaperone TorD